MIALILCGLGTASADECSDTDYGEKQFDPGVATDSSQSIADVCLDGTTLREAFCNSDDDTVGTVDITCEFGCYGDAGACFRVNDRCTDSDYGSVVTVRGLLKDRTQRFTNENQKWDACKSDGVTLLERSCDEQGFLETTQVSCPEGCDHPDGDACHIPPTCEDSDGGIYPLVPGSVVYLDNNEEEVTKFDECVDAWNLKERVCNGNGKASNVRLRCAQGCDGGLGVCNSSEPFRELGVDEFWDNGFNEVCFYSKYDEFKHLVDCENDNDPPNPPTSKYWQIDFKSGEPSDTQAAITNGCASVELVYDEGSFEGLRLVQDHGPEMNDCNDDKDGWMAAQLIQKSGHPQFPHVDEMVTRVVLRMENQIDPVIDDSATRYFMLLKGRLRPSNPDPPEWLDYILSIQFARDKPGTPGDFDLPCVATARRCNDGDACGGDPMNPNDNGYIVHLYGTCFDVWIESGEEREIRIDWQEVLNYVKPLREFLPDGPLIFPEFEEIKVTTVRLGMEIKPGRPDRVRSSELLIKDFKIYSKDSVPP